MDIYLFELTTHLFELKTLIRSNCASSNFDLVGSCAFSIMSIPLPIMSAQSLSQPYHGCSSDDDSSTDRKAMSHKRSKPALSLQDTVIYLLPTSFMSTRRRGILLPEIRRKGGEVTDDPSIATHCVVTPFPVDEVIMKRLCSKYAVPDSCICVPDSFLFTVPEVLQVREAVLAQTTEARRQRQHWHEAMSHTVTEGIQDAMNEANNLRIPREGRVAGDEHAA
jgi:hypothetical protein